MPNLSKMELYAALAKAKASFKTIEKKRIAVTKQYKYKYANLADVIEATAKGLSDNNLGFMQTVSSDHSRVETTVFHSSGQSETTNYPIIWEVDPESKKDPVQELQAAVEKVRRYGLCLALGVSSEETMDQPAQESLTRQAKSDAAADVLAEKGHIALADMLIDKIEGYKNIKFLNAYWSGGHGPGYMVLKEFGDNDQTNRVLKAYNAHRKYLEDER